jgi:hypothetical protein
LTLRVEPSYPHFTTSALLGRPLIAPGVVFRMVVLVESWSCDVVAICHSVGDVGVCTASRSNSSSHC